LRRRKYGNSKAHGLGPEIGIQFRKDSPFPHSFMMELVNGYYGYMPTAAEQMLTALKEMCGELKQP
jgi:hypothetical protein